MYGTLLRSIIKVRIPIRSICTTPCHRYNEVMRIIGDREIVGYGMNGQPIYEDSVTFPYPAIRFREITPALKAIKEKERGDWKSLTISEKKCLYRISFCQTLSEANHPTGEAKSIIGLGLVFVNIAVLFYMLIFLLTRVPIPETFAKHRQEAQLRRMIDLRMHPFSGPASKWDYEEDDWLANTEKYKKPKNDE